MALGYGVASSTIGGSGGGGGANCITDDVKEGGFGERWKLRKIYSMDELMKSKPIMCSNFDCDLVACSRWESTEDGNPWFLCLNCQET